MKAPVLVVLILLATAPKALAVDLVLEAGNVGEVYPAAYFQTFDLPDGPSLASGETMFQIRFAQDKALQVVDTNPTTSDPGVFVQLALFHGQADIPAAVDGPPSLVSLSGTAEFPDAVGGFVESGGGGSGNSSGVFFTTRVPLTPGYVFDGLAITANLTPSASSSLSLPPEDYSFTSGRLQINTNPSSSIDLVVVVPEPSSFAVFGLVGLLAIRRR